MRTLDKILQPRPLLLSMILLQMLWLSATWLANVASNWWKLPILLVYSLAVGVAILLLPVRLERWLRRFKIRYVRNERILLVGLCLAVFAGGAVYAIFSRSWPDERHAFEAAAVIAEDGLAQFFSDYAQLTWLGRQHPPLIPLLYGAVLRLVGLNLYAIRLVSLLSAVGTILTTYALSDELYGQSSRWLAVLFMVCMPLFLLHGSTAMIDMQVTFFFSLAMLTILRLRREASWQLAVAAGVVIGMGLLSKYTMVLIYPLLLCLFLMDAPLRQRKPHLAIVLLVSLSILAGWLAFAYRLGLLETQTSTLTFYAGVVTRLGFGIQFLLENLLTKLPSALGVYNLPWLLLGIVHAARRRNQADLYVLLWAFVIFVLVTITLPDKRYYMPAFPALAILMALGLGRIRGGSFRTITLALFYCAGTLYLLVDWYRADHLFVR